MVWKRRGRIFRAAGQRPWMRSHTACPVVLPLADGRWRIYFGTRDLQQKAHVAYIEVDSKHPSNVLKVSDAPVLAPGEFGLFDENGVYPGSIVHDGDRLLMYYMGRVNLEAPRFAMAIGLAESRDGGKTFIRLSRAPIMDRNDEDPWMVSTPFVLRDRDRWRMWYLSGKGWTSDGVGSFYALRQAWSSDGINWSRQHGWALDLNDSETNIASPTVLRDESGWHMWFCTFVDGSYRLGYAASSDGISWQRENTGAVMEETVEDWDRDTVAYPHVVATGDKFVLIYSGRGYGFEGLGFCLAEKDA